MAVINNEGPKYQYVTGCLSNGLAGAWLSRVCELEEFIDREKVSSHLLAVYRFNFKKSLSKHANLMRSVFASEEDSGLVVCTWLKGGRPSLPLIYADEVFTGIEYEIASYLIIAGEIEKGLELVRATRRRYDGRARNPFAEIEAGQWYARAMSSYALLGALSGARFDAVEKVLYLRPAVRGDFRCWSGPHFDRDRLWNRRHRTREALYLSYSRENSLPGNSIYSRTCLSLGVS